MSPAQHAPRTSVIVTGFVVKSKYKKAKTPAGTYDRIVQGKQEVLGGSVKRSLAMAFLGCGGTLAKAFGLDAATRPDCHFSVVHPGRPSHNCHRRLAAAFAK